MDKTLGAPPSPCRCFSGQGGLATPNAPSSVATDSSNPIQPSHWRLRRVDEVTRGPNAIYSGTQSAILFRRIQDALQQHGKTHRNHRIGARLHGYASTGNSAGRG